MATVEELLAARGEKQATERRQREAKHAVELEEKVLPLLDEDGDRFLFSQKPLDSDLCGFVVLKPATEAQIARYRHVLWKSASDKGATEAKAKAGPELARHCVVYPAAEVLAQLVERHPMILDKIAVAIIHKAEAAEVEEGKG